MLIFHENKLIHTDDFNDVIDYLANNRYAKQYYDKHNRGY